MKHLGIFLWGVAILLIGAGWWGLALPVLMFPLTWMLYKWQLKDEAKKEFENKYVLLFMKLREQGKSEEEIEEIRQGLKKAFNEYQKFAGRPQI